MKLLAIAGFILWIYLLTVIKRGKNDFLFFLVGSVGMFVFCMIWLHPPLTTPVIKLVAAVSGLLGKVTGFFDSYFEYGMMFINAGEDSLSLYIDYECSGIIEIFAYSCLLWFFPVYVWYEKLLLNIIGFVYIVAANVLRIFVICTAIHFFGNDVYFLAHTIIGRIIFYGLSIALYFYVFTRSQVIRQKVGKFKYGTE